MSVGGQQKERVQEKMTGNGGVYWEAVWESSTVETFCNL